MTNRIFDKHRVFNVSYHIVWIPKYRKHILKNEIRQELIKCLEEKANQLKISLEAYEIMSDHVHLFIKSNPNITISEIVKHLKGYSSYILRKKFKELKKYKSLWTPSYYCETIGLISESTIRKYIEMQTENK
jgi:putative transposase